MKLRYLPFRLLPLLPLLPLVACAVAPEGSPTEPDAPADRTGATESAMIIHTARLLVITSDELAPSLTRFIDHKRATGMSAMLVTVSQLRAAARGSADDATLIKRFIAMRARNHHAAYVMLAGDPTHVPVRYRAVRDPSDTATYSFNPTDLYYANLYRNHDASGAHGNELDTWDLDGDGLFNEEKWDSNVSASWNPDGVDGYPDVAVARVPAANAAQMDVFVDKVIRYETWGESMPGARRSAFFIDKDYGGADWMASSIEASLAVGRAEHAHFGLSYGPSDVVPAPYLRGAAADVGAEAARSGLLVYVGHGWVGGWGGGWVDGAAVAQHATSTTNLPVVVSVACDTGQFSPYAAGSVGTPDPKSGQRSFASDWLFPSSGQATGAVAYFGEMLVAPNNWGTELARNMTRQISAGTRILGDVYRNAQARYWATMGKDDVLGAPRVYLGIMTMFGDPSLRLNIPVRNQQTLRAGDFDGDGKADPGTWRPSNGGWSIRNSGSAWRQLSYGIAGDTPAPGDYDGDGKTDVAVWRPSAGRWYLQTTTAPWGEVRFGEAGDVPVPADYDGDGRTDIAIWRPSDGHWHVRTTSDAPFSVQYGTSGDIPVPGDYDGDGFVDIAVWRPSLGRWFLRSTGSAWRQIDFGTAGDIPVAVDFDGDGKTNIAVWRPSNGRWYIQLPDYTTQEVHFGERGDVPVPADYDGDGKADIAIWRPSDGVWHIRGSSSGGQSFAYGVTGDVPLNRTR